MSASTETGYAAGSMATAKKKKKAQKSATKPFVSVTAYLAAQPKEVRAVLEEVRGAIKGAVRGLDEGISYNIPAYKLADKTVVYFAGWKKHVSIYPATKGVVTTFAKELSDYEVNDKGTIRFPLTAVPIKLIASITKLRAKEVAEAAKPAAATSKAKKKT